MEAEKRNTEAPISHREPAHCWDCIRIFELSRTVPSLSPNEARCFKGKLRGELILQFDILLQILIDFVVNLWLCNLITFGPQSLPVLS
jgi:hypothetical protein